MDVVKWEPFREMANLQDRMQRLFQEMGFGRYDRPSPDVQGARWAPAVDVYETEGEIVLKAELPEIDRKDVEISIENNVLTLQGERKQEKEVTKDCYHCMERAYGSFFRSFSLPSTVDQEKVKADFKDGILKITLPKKPEHKPKQISIDIG